MSTLCNNPNQPFRTASFAGLLTLAGAGAILLSRPARGDMTVSTWALGMDGSWNIAENWLPGGVPNNAGPVTFHAWIQSGHDVSLDLAATVTNLSIGLSDELLLGGPSLTVNAGVIENEGLISISSTASLRIQGIATVASGNESGEIVLSGSAPSKIVGIGSLPRLVQEVGHTIRGRGLVGEAGLSMTNRGLVAADDALGLLELRPDSSGDITNESLLVARDGGKLVLRGFQTLFTGQFLNDGGTIRAEDGSLVELVWLQRIAGGVIETEETGLVTLESGSNVTLDGVENAGAMILEDGSAMHLPGPAFTNSGAITVGTGPGSAHIILGAPVSIGGEGSIELTSLSTSIFGNVAPDPRVINVDNWIHGSGYVQNGGGGVTNEAGGTIEADRSTALVVKASSLYDFQNHGTLLATGDAGMVIEGLMTTDGLVGITSNSKIVRVGPYTQTGGETHVTGRLETIGGGAAPVNINGGTLKGTGIVDANVVVGASGAATVAPGASAGTLTIDGNYTQNASGTLAIELAGTTPGTGHDVLAITGNATLGGTLTVDLLGLYIPEPGDEYTVLTATGSITGFFTPGAGTTGFDIDYEPHAVVLRVPTCPADLDNSLDVGFGDLTLLLLSWGGCPALPADCAGDLDFSGNRGFGDLTLLLIAWGPCP